MGIFVSDSFTDTDSTDLASHTGELGASWTKHSSFTDSILIQSNRAGKDSNTGTSVYYASGAPPGLEYTVEGPIIDVGDVNRASGICGWVNTSADHMVVMRRQTSTAWQLLKIIGGVATSIDTEATTFSAGAIRTLKITRVGDLFEWFLDGVSLGAFTISDAEFQSPGRVGLRASNIHVGTGFHVDSLVAYTNPNVIPYFGGGHSPYRRIVRVSSY